MSATLGVAVTPAVASERTRTLTAQLAALLGFSWRWCGTDEADVLVAAPDEQTTGRALTLRSRAAWSDPAKVHVNWVDDVPLLHERGARPPVLIRATEVAADVLGALEFLTGGEEILSDAADELGRFRPSYSVIDELGLDSYDVVGRAAARMRSVISAHRPDLTAPGWGGRGFAVALTHDIDSLFDARPSFRAASHLMRAGLRARSTRAVADGAVELARLALRHQRSRPAFNFAAWAAAEHELDVRATYHFAADPEPGRHVDDPWYGHGEMGTYRERQIPLSEAVKALAAEGHEIGIHFTIASLVDSARTAREIASVSALAARPIVSARAHHLAWRPGARIRVLASLGIRHDSSSGGVGFTRATGAPFNVGSGQTIVPTVVMDDLLLKPSRLGLPSDLAWRRIERVLSELRATGGAAAVLFHTDVPDRLALYRRLIDWVADHSGALTTVEELGRMWLSRTTPAV